jgi:RimJ/RimL family protein N-acetyltransferase
MWADPEVTRYIGGVPSTPEQTWSRLLRYVGHWSLLGFGYWVVCERTTGRFVGEVGFADFKRDLKPPLGATPESGWALATWAHGRGYATEAVKTALVWGDQHLKSKRTVCLIAPEHQASIRVAAKCGYSSAGTGIYKGETSNLYERYAPTIA